MRWLVVLALLVSPNVSYGLSPLTREQSELLQEGLVVTADEFILPAYEVQAQEAHSMAAALAAFCADNGTLEAVHQGFAGTFLAWQRASIIQFGPVTEAEGPMRIQLWPDPKGFADRAVRSALRDQDAALLSGDGLKGRSIALTGLTALEDLVYADLQPGSYDCGLAHAIARFQAALAEDLRTAWTPGSPYRADYDSASTGNGTYPDVDSLIRKFLAGTVVYVDRLRKFKLLRGLGQGAGDARPERTEARQSGLGLASIETGFRTLAALYETPFGLFDIAPDIGGSMDYYVLGETAASVADSLAFETASLADIAQQDGDAAAELRRFADLVLYHESFLKSGFLGALGLSIGFTAADGD